jgi:hypothetical protein
VRVGEYDNPPGAGDAGEVIATLLVVVRTERDHFVGAFAAARGAGGDAGPRAEPDGAEADGTDSGDAPGE